MGTACDELKKKVQEMTDADAKAALAAPILLEACRAVLNLAGEDCDLPDNGEYSGAAITDLVRAAVGEASI